MRFKIYEMVKPEHLQKTEPDGYYIKTTERVILELPSYDSGFSDDYASIQDANQAIINNKENSKCMELCILPVVRISYDGEVI